ncbi:MAG TPA: aminotransferase class III-fold pyridoxal phosphate-dependent enzyme [Phycisphaeraceae bacterium]
MTASQERVAAASGSVGWLLYEQAKALIPGGTQLLSKRPEMFLPSGWPCYFQRAKGCRVWDLEGREFIDMTINGIGACLLGFADDAVDAAVKACIDRGTMCTLNDPAELTLAQRLIALHPWAERVRYARSGGEAMAVAVRIARAATGRDVVLFCGYHGWHDWYLSANLAEDRALDGHLLPGLAPKGVPRGLTGTALPFRYGEVDELRSLLERRGKEVAAIVMEPMRYDDPPAGFLEQVRALADEHGAVLIFDEITSGWRHHLGGVHLKFGVSPDVAVFAKSMSNGYPMAAIVGRPFPMDAAQESFISSTYWTESIGPTAALATLERMQALDLPQRLARAGEQVREGWQRLIERHGLPAKVAGRPALMHMSFELGSAQASRSLVTLLTQLMLDRGFLANAAYYATAAHDSAVIDRYLAALDESFGELRAALDQGDVARHLRGPVAHSGFQRLT